MSGIVATVKLFNDSSNVRLAVDTTPSFTAPVFSAAAQTTNRRARLEVSGLTANTSYVCAVEVDGVIHTDHIGSFRTKPTGPASFKCAFAGDAGTGSTHDVFDRIRAQGPLFFFHLGDLHYENISVNSVDAYHNAYDRVMASNKQSQLYREVPTYYTWDDHDFGPDDSYGGSPGRSAACAAYRANVPHPPLAKDVAATDPIYFSFEIGRVLFIVTDLRSMSSNKSATDNSSKTMMGTEQKAWFKGTLSDPANAGKFFVWICSRVWGGAATAGADHWGGFTTERAELADHIKTHALGRICVISADMHSLAIDDGANHNFATGGGCPIPTFQAAPLDRASAQTYGGGTYNVGAGRYMNNGQFGVMEITDTSGADITIDWTGYDSLGTALVTHQFTATLGAP